MIFPIFAQETVNMTEMSNITAITNTTGEISIITTTTPSLWNFGIFAIIGAAFTFIGILLTIRFVYIDRIYSEKIKILNDDIEKELENQEILFDTNQFTKNNVRWLADFISSLNLGLAELTRHRKENNHEGLLVDITCMAGLLLTGTVATTGFFEGKFILLPVIVGFIAFFPVLHFVSQLKKSKFEIHFNHS